MFCLASRGAPGFVLGPEDVSNDIRAGLLGTEIVLIIIYRMLCILLLGDKEEYEIQIHLLVSTSFCAVSILGLSELLHKPTVSSGANLCLV